MSRLGIIPVTVPKSVKVAIGPQTVNVEGPKGKLSLSIPTGIKLEQKDDKVTINRLNDLKQSRANHGTVRALLVNMIVGVTEGHKKDLEIQGVGFKAAAQGNKLTLNVGYSHPIEYLIPNDIKVTSAKPTEISIEGADKSIVGLVARKIREFKRPEPYKGKGIRYAGEIIRRKQGKSVTK